MNIPPQKGAKSQGAGKLGALESRYGTSKKLAQEATQVALQKATEKKLNPGKTSTGQPAEDVIINPDKLDMKNQTVN